MKRAQSNQVSPVILSERGKGVDAMKRFNRMFVLSAMVGMLTVAATAAFADIPLMINHQGLVKVGGGPFTGTGSFKFGFVSGSATWLWTNDGTHVGESVATAPDTPVSLSVNYGVYNVRLGDTTLTGMTAIPSSVFDSDEVRLRVLFNDGTTGEEVLSPDQPITSAAYSYHAATADTADAATPALFEAFSGDGSDGDVTVSSSVDFSTLTGSTDNCYLGATSFTVDAGQTVTVDAGFAYIGVQGTCTIHGTIDADGQGCAGGTGGMSGGPSGRMGENADGFGDPSDPADRGSDLSSSDFIGIASLLPQISLPFALSGAGGGAGGSGLTDGGCGGGAGGHGGRGGGASSGQNGNITPASKRILLTGGLGDNSAHSRRFNPAILQFRGAGGGSGAGGGTTPRNAGGDGGGVIYIECETLVFDGTLTANGTNGVGQSGPDANGGGGGGGGGVILVRAKTIVTNTGTVTVSGGSGGTTGVSFAGGDGADGFMDIIQVK